jgi:hypothetical protein
MSYLNCKSLSVLFCRRDQVCDYRELLSWGNSESDYILQIMFSKETLHVLFLQSPYETRSLDGQEGKWFLWIETYLYIHSKNKNILNASMLHAMPDVGDILVTQTKSPLLYSSGRKWMKWQMSKILYLFFFPLKRKEQARSVKGQISTRKSMSVFLSILWPKK